MKRIIHQMNMLLCILPFRWWMEVLNDGAHPCFTLWKFISSFFFRFCCFPFLLLHKIWRRENMCVCLCVFFYFINWCMVFFYARSTSSLSLVFAIKSVLWLNKPCFAPPLVRRIEQELFEATVNGRQMNWIEHWKYVKYCQHIIHSNLIDVPQLEFGYRYIIKKNILPLLLIKSNEKSIFYFSFFVCCILQFDDLNFLFGCCDRMNFFFC